MEKLRSLIAALDHFDKAWAALPPSASNFLGMEFPRLARRWGKLTAVGRRKVIREYAQHQAADLGMAIGFDEISGAEDTADRHRRKLTLVGEILDKLACPKSRPQTRAGDAKRAKSSQSQKATPVPTARPPHPARKLGAPSRRSDAAHKWFEVKYPGGVPGDRTLVSLQAEMQADKVIVSTKTIGRVLKR